MMSALLPFLMSDKGRDMYLQIPFYERNTYEDAKYAMFDRYEPDWMSDQFCLMFENQKQQVNESVDQFVILLQKLCRRSNPRLFTESAL